MSAPDRPGDVPCRCGHPRDAHEHYRKGTECALCDVCPRYRSSAGLLARLLARLSR